MSSRVDRTKLTTACAISSTAATSESSSRTVSATRTYPNLSGADVSLIPKSITDSGRTLTLADVQWQEAATTQTDGYDMALRYTATATYTGTATSKYATGYVVTANYAGEVTRVSADVITYTAVFSSGDPTPAAESTPAPTDTQQPTQESSSFSFDWKWLLIPLGVGALGEVVDYRAAMTILNLVLVAVCWWVIWRGRADVKAVYDRPV